MNRSQSTNLRILFAADVLPDPDSGAAGTEVRTIEELRRRGHEVEEIWADQLPRRIRHGNLHYLLELPDAYRRIIEARMRARDYDVVHVNQGHCFAAARAHQRRRRRGVFVYRSHGLDDHMEAVLRPWRERLGLEDPRAPATRARRLLQALLARHDRLACRFADGVLVSCGNDRDYLLSAHGLDTRRVGCVPQAPAEAFVQAPLRPMDPQRLRRVLHVGGFAYWKGVHAVAAAARELLQEGSDVELTWVCREDEQDRVRALLPVHVRERVILRSWVPQGELARLFDAHGVFLAPSLFEGFNKVFLEAMARGLCVVGTTAGGMGDVIVDGCNGCIVSPDDGAGVAAAVRALQRDPDAASRLASAAARTAREYSWTRTAREIEAFYASLLGLRGERAAGGAQA